MFATPTEPRRAPLEFDGALAGALALCAGATAAVTPVLTWLATGAALALASRHLKPPALLLLLGAAALSAARANCAIDAHRAARARAEAHLPHPRRCAFQATVTRSPVLRRGTLSFAAKAENLDCEGNSYPTPVQLRLYGAPSAIARGARVQGIADLARVRLLRNFDLADPWPQAARSQAVLSGGVQVLEILEPGRGLGARVDRFRAHVRGRIAATFAPVAQPLARALVLGETDLEPGDSRAFAESGLAHLLAVSGTHLVLAVAAVVEALRRALAHVPALAQRTDVGRIAAAAGCVLAPAYADFAGGSGSAQRAAWMLCTAFAATALGRRATATRSLAASLAGGWALDPLVAFDVSFMLSVAASAGLLTLARRARGGAGPLGFVSSATATTIAATLPCVPFLLLLGPRLTLASVAGNLLAGPLGELIALPLCLAHSVLAVWPALEQGVALVASGALTLVRGIAHASAAAPLLHFDWPPPSAAQLGVAALGAFGAWTLLAQPTAVVPPVRLRDSNQAAGAARRANPGAVARSGRSVSWRWPATAGWLLISALAFIWCEHAQRAKGEPNADPSRPPRLRLTALDVGQGDSTLIDLPDGRLLLVDGGGLVGSPVDPGARVILPALRARRRSRIDVMVVSHAHPDHYSGLLAVTQEAAVGEIWIPTTGRQGGPYQRWLDELQARGVPVLQPPELCGRSLADSYELRVIAPCPEADPQLGLNDNSLVLRVGLGAHSALLVGDAERARELQLLRDASAALRASFLKVGHHGSDTSSSAEFLAAVSPEVASISSGVRNRFGHPRPGALQRLEQAARLVTRLDQSGAVQWITDGRSQRLRRWAQARYPSATRVRPKTAPARPDPPGPPRDD